MKINTGFKLIKINYRFAVLLFIILLTFAAKSQESKLFLINMTVFCNQSYEGRVNFPEEDKNPFKGQQLLLFFKSCSDSSLIMPFHVGNDSSRTWMLGFENDKLMFKHDHRHSDGTPDSITNYGGYALEIGDSFNQIFPADAFTSDLIPAAATNEWAFKLDFETKTLNYELKRNDQLRFKAVFDLSKPM